MMRYMAAVPLLLAAMSAQNAPSTTKGRHLDIPAISREANGAIVSIVMSDKEGHPIAQGSGFFISKDGRLVTNYHVIKNGSSAVVKRPDGAFFVVDGVLASDKDRDVAIVKVNGNSFKALTLGDSDRLQVGEEVVAIGNPLSLESTVSNGIVSAIRTIEDEGGKFVQITAPISPGSSGGPLFNMAGEVVGITTSHIKGGENLNFAIPINAVKPTLLPRLSKKRALPDEPEDKTTSTEQQPDLEDTVNFMRNMVEADGRFIGYDGDLTDSCHITFSGRYRRVGLIVDGVKHDEYGKTEPTYSVIQELPFVRVSLGAIDPLTIRSTSAPSLEYMEKTKKAHGEVLPSDIEHSDQTIVWFKDSDGSMKGLLIFLSEDRAARFVTAMKHAAALCGGKESPFAPTTTQ
jgi:V8-like Glu-specific endopeptidase